MKTKIFSVIYFWIGVLFILLHDHSSVLIDLILKRLIITVLIIVFLLNQKKGYTLLNCLMLAGMFFSWAGDVVLQFSFVPGLVFFLLAHLMYLSLFFMTPGKSIIFTSHK